MALKATSLEVLTWEGPIQADSVITATLERKIFGGSDTMTYEAVFRSAYGRENWNLEPSWFLLDKDVSIGAYGELAVHADQIYREQPLWRRMATSSKEWGNDREWVRKHVDFGIKPYSADTQSRPGEQLVIGQWLQAAPLIDGKREYMGEIPREQFRVYWKIVDVTTNSPTPAVVNY